MSDWREMVDQANGGQFFYFNVRTRERQLVPPDGWEEHYEKQLRQAGIAGAADVSADPSEGGYSQWRTKKGAVPSLAESAVSWGTYCKRQAMLGKQPDIDEYRALKYYSEQQEKKQSTPQQKQLQHHQQYIQDRQQQYQLKREQYQQRRQSIADR
jgi:hypothetical protein